MANFSPQTRQMMTAAQAPDSAFGAAWGAVAPGLGVGRLWYTRESTGKRLIAGGSVRVDIDIRADQKTEAFMRRLTRMPAHIRKNANKIIRDAVREEVIHRLKQNIPQSDRRKKHLRATAQIMESNIARTIVGVGSTDLWYASVLHAGGVNRVRRRHPFTGKTTGTAKPVPFFPITFRKAAGPLADRMIRDIYNMMGWLADGKKRGQLR